MSACRNKVSTVSVIGPDGALVSGVVGAGTARRRTSICVLASAGGCRVRLRDGPGGGEAGGGGGCLLLLGRGSAGRSLGCKFGTHFSNGSGSSHSMALHSAV